MAQGWVAVYVQGRYAKPAYKRESYDVRTWPGLEMVCHALRRAGIEVEYCSSATVSRYKVILVSITSSCDWYPFLAERARWTKHGVVIAGGAGVLNVRPFLPYVDIFCFGRAEDLIVPLVQAVLRGNRYDHPSVCYSSEFSMDKRYVINTVTEVYPHEIRLANGKRWKETAIGCQRKCLFCGYTWHRRHVGGLQAESGAGNALWGNASSERTLFELDLDDPASWDLQHLRIVGLDGFSERLRRMVNKPITREMFRAFLRGLGVSGTSGKMKVYNIVGYPTETEEDWLELAEDLAAADRRLPKSQTHRWGIVLHCTPFRAVPATPAATWPMSYANYRGWISWVLRQGREEDKSHVFYAGNRLWAAESHATESLATTVLEALAIRGTEEDTEIAVRLAASRKFANAALPRKLAILERYVDIDRLFRGYTWDDLPTRYLGTYVDVEKMKRADAMARKRSGCGERFPPAAVLVDGRRRSELGA